MLGLIFVLLLAQGPAQKPVAPKPLTAEQQNDELRSRLAVQQSFQALRALIEQFHTSKGYREALTALEQAQDAHGRLVGKLQKDAGAEGCALAEKGAWKCEAPKVANGGPPERK